MLPFIEQPDGEPNNRRRRSQPAEDNNFTSHFDNQTSIIFATLAEKAIYQEFIESKSNINISINSTIQAIIIAVIIQIF